jgi:hypothetical protein
VHWQDGGTLAKPKLEMAASGGGERAPYNTNFHAAPWKTSNESPLPAARKTPAFATNGELLFVWKRVRELLPAHRAMSKNQSFWRNLEAVGDAFIKSMEAGGCAT